MLSDPRTPPTADAIPINWNYPAPRGGLPGQWDKFVGPGATKTEILILFGIAGPLALFLLVYNLLTFPEWSVIQQFVAFIVAFDILGGVISNAMSSGKRWYHREGYGLKSRLLFMVAHAFHPAIIVIFFAPDQWLWFIIIYVYLLVASLCILSVPVYTQRPVAMGLFALGIVIGAVVPLGVAGFAWFLPIFYAKLLISYLVREEPYRPTADA